MDAFIERLADETRLDLQESAALVWHFLDGVPHEAVADKLGVTPGQAQGLAYNGLRNVVATARVLKDAESIIAQSLAVLATRMEAVLT